MRCVLIIMNNYKKSLVTYLKHIVSVCITEIPRSNLCNHIPTNRYRKRSDKQTLFRTTVQQYLHSGQRKTVSFFYYKFKPQFLFRSFFCVCFRITVLVFCDAYQPLKGHAGISTPPTSRQRQETAGNAYHFNPSSSNHGYLNTDNNIVGRNFKLITSGGGSDRKQNLF